MKEHKRSGAQSLVNGSEIRKLRVSLGISQEELAHAVGVEQSLVSKIELDRIKSTYTRLRIREILKSWALN